MQECKNIPNRLEEALDVTGIVDKIQLQHKKLHVQKMQQRNPIFQNLL